MQDYLSIINSPMDLQTITENIKKGDHYTSKEALKTDLDLMVANCKLYNQDAPDSPYIQAANELSTLLGTLFPVAASS